MKNKIVFHPRIFSSGDIVVFMIFCRLLDHFVDAILDQIKNSSIKTAQYEKTSIVNIKTYNQLKEKKLSSINILYWPFLFCISRRICHEKTLINL